MHASFASLLGTQAEECAQNMGPLQDTHIREESVETHRAERGRGRNESTGRSHRELGGSGRAGDHLTQPDPGGPGGETGWRDAKILAGGEERG